MNTARRFQIGLPDGRDLDVYDSGPREHPVLLFHHGSPGSCLPFRAIDAAAQRHGLRVVQASRPGYANSTRLPGRSVVDGVDDSAALLDALGIDRCFVAGWSGGGPHALACGARLAPRVRAVLVIAGLAPYDSPGFTFTDGMSEGNVTGFGTALEGEAALRPRLEERRARLIEATAGELVTMLVTPLPAVDRRAVAGEVGEDLAAEVREGIRDGVDGLLDDNLAFVAPWGCALTEVAVPTRVWHGDQDVLAPCGHGQWLATHLPDAIFHLEPGEGHLSICIGFIDQMLQELVAAE